MSVLSGSGARQPLKELPALGDLRGAHLAPPAAKRQDLVALDLGREVQAFDLSAGDAWRFGDLHLASAVLGNAATPAPDEAGPVQIEAHQMPWSGPFVSGSRPSHFSASLIIARELDQAARKAKNSAGSVRPLSSVDGR